MVSEENIGELDGNGYDFVCGLKKNKVVKAILREVEAAKLLSEELFTIRRRRHLRSVTGIKR